MIDPVDFKGMCDRVARVTGRIDEEQRAVYYEAFKDVKREVLFRAMKRVAREHGFYKFPTIAEIMDAVHDSSTETRNRIPSVCDICNMTGIVIVESGGYNKAYRCECENGKHVSSLIPPFARVASLYLPPEGVEERLPLISLADLESLPVTKTYPDGVGVGKMCQVCWKPYVFEHRRKISVGQLRDFHLGKQTVCEDCHIQGGKDRGLWM